MGVLTGLLLLTLVLAVVFQDRIIYIPHPYAAGAVEKWASQTGAKVLDFQTTDGPQHAYLLSRSSSPRHLWVVCGGSGSVSLDWSDWLRDRGPQDDAWLFVDIPGYGANAGSPSPEAIARSVKTSVPLAVEALHWTTDEAGHRLRFFGHSIGAAVCLIAARENDIRQGVLLTPFTSTMEMASAWTGLPLGPLLRHRFDNRERLLEIEAKGGGHVILLHGTRDETIPVSMSRDLAKRAPHTVKLIEIPDGRHNNLPEFAPQEIEKALREAAGDR
ncbi:alpha/beta hydrolase [Luteolibacter ambystomatis]|uniref:Alpha/beta hydrolase n=1 Tax=Luteolibacter ambystomatis TaxID=2824561 RepID=A0A975J1T5_9BACT|nr:alpha/beta hydrolase [Luteolibacter ambystomatis]QUE52468.1 alpha/beta hydrolase [Luteolibacter ambystomatis]